MNTAPVKVETNLRDIMTTNKAGNSYADERLVSLHLNTTTSAAAATHTNPWTRGTTTSAQYKNGHSPTDSDVLQADEDSATLGIAGEKLV